VQFTLSYVRILVLRVFVFFWSQNFSKKTPLFQFEYLEMYLKTWNFA
jgi:hypothetical protein